MRSFSKTKTFQTKLSRQVPRPGTSFLDFPMGGKDVTPAGKLVILLDIASAPTKPEDGAPQHGTMAAAAARHGVSSTFVRLLWKRHGQHARDALAAPVLDHAALLALLQPKRGKRCGVKPHALLPLQRCIAQLEPEAKSTYRSAAYNSGIPASSLHRYVKNGLLKTVTSTIKPRLTEEHKRRRVEFCLNNLIQSYDLNSDVLSFEFPDFDDVIHVDEKIFKLDKIRRSYILAPWETPPMRSAQNKRFIGQLMFLCAVAKPRWNSASNQWFDGKLGIWAFVQAVPAARASKNRPRGAPVLTSISVNAAAYSKMLEERLRPAILAKWPRDVHHVRIQQDNAPAHPASGRWFSEAGLTVDFVCQPAQSPDLNVLDLGYFAAIQALQQKRRTKTLEELITAVEESFAALNRDTLENIFLTWCACMEQVMLCAGDNQYSIPHLKKAQLRRVEGTLPMRFSCSVEAATIAGLVLL
jgi:hypothetical protein